MESKRETERGKKEMYKERKNKQTAGDRPSASAQSHVPAVIAGTLGSGLPGQ